MHQKGDKVVATETLRRIDGRSNLHVGESARITGVYTSETSQIVSIEIEGKLPMCDIVCFSDSSPLKKEKKGG